MKLGVIEEGKLKGKKIILEPRKDLPKNLYLVEKGTFINGSPNFALFCLVCDKEVPVNGCAKCNNLNKKNVK